MSALVRRALKGFAALALLSAAAPAQVLIGPPASLPVDDADEVYVGDLDNDGHLDLFVAPDFFVFTSNTFYSVALGNGDGTFGAAGVTSSQSSYWGRGDLVDMDADGNLDFIVPADNAFQDPHIRIYHGAGDGSFPTSTTLNEQIFSGSVCVGRDLDGDSDRDMLLGISEFGSGAVLQVLLADGGGYVAAPDLDVGAGAFLETVGDLDTGDVDGDGLLDIVAATIDSSTSQHTLAIFLGTAPGAWGPQATSPLPAAPHALSLADLDGNGDLDVVLRDGNGDVLVFLGDGAGAFGPPSSTNVGPAVLPSSSQHLAVDDLDGDGDLDAVAPHGTEVTVIQNQGDGSFVPLHVSRTFAAHGVGLGDFDEDGDLDLGVAGGTDCGGGDCPGLVFLMSNETYPAGSPFTDVGAQLAGANGYPIHIASGTLVTHTPFLFDVYNAPPLSTAFVVAGASELSAPFKGGTLVPNPDVVVALPTDAAGRVAAGGLWPNTVPSGLTLWIQWWFNDAGGVLGKSSTTALRALTP